MKLITRDTDYAIQALRYIAGQKNRVVSVAELAKEIRIPRPFLRKLLQILNKRKFLVSYKGQGGGFKLRVDPKNIYITQIMEVFQGPITLSEHLIRKKMCPQVKKCKFKKKLDELEKNVVSKLRNITLASIL